MQRVLIAYSGRNLQKVWGIVKRIEHRSDDLRVWFAHRDLGAGEDPLKAFARRLAEASVVLMCEGGGTQKKLGGFVSKEKEMIRTASRARPHLQVFSLLLTPGAAARYRQGRTFSSAARGIPPLRLYGARWERKIDILTDMIVSA